MDSSIDAYLPHPACLRFSARLELLKYYHVTIYPLEDPAEPSGRGSLYSPPRPPAPSICYILAGCLF